jgi:hypothetical protein
MAKNFSYRTSDDSMMSEEDLIHDEEERVRVIKSPPVFLPGEE